MKRSSRAESDPPAHRNGVSSSAQPAAKVVKIEEEEAVPSQEELRQKVAKLEKDFEVACRVAGEEQVRVRFLEDQLVDQRRLTTEQATACEGQKNLVEELQKKLTEASTVIEDARKEAVDAKISEEELKERLNCLTLLLDTERARVKNEQSRVASLTHQLATERSRAIEDRMRGHASMNWMGRRVDEVNRELEHRVASLTQQLVAEKSRAIEDRMGDRQRIDELMHTLAQQQWLLLQQPLPGKDSETQTDAPADKKSEKDDGEKKLVDELQRKVEELTRQLVPYEEEGAAKGLLREQKEQRKLLETARRLQRERDLRQQQTNIFKCSSSNTRQTISMIDAIDQLREHYHMQKSNWRRRYMQAIRDEEKPFCPVCMVILQKKEILEHFFSMGHTNNLKRGEVFISRAAFEYWLGKLKSIRKPAAAAAPIDEGEEDT